MFVPVSVEQTSDITFVQQWYFKDPYEDYAPSGVPDFDQRQDNWNNSAGVWTWCGPTSVADSLWWLDSKLEPSPVPPPVVSDHFPLVMPYDAAWDDHDPMNVEPFVEDLAWLMDTDGQRTGSTHSGTKVSDMEAGINQYLAGGGVDVMFYVKKVRAPDAAMISDEVINSNDVILLLGFYQLIRGRFYRVGGHFVTVSGVNPPPVDFASFIAFSDPIKDNAEPPPRGTGGSGQVLPPPPHPHTLAPPYLLHNNASYISHDFYDLKPDIPTCPGGVWGIYYGAIEVIEDYGNDGWQNFPDELDEEGIKPGRYDPFYGSVYVEVEYAVIVSPIRDVAITNVTPRKTIVGQNYTMDIDVTVFNEGILTETFNVTTYYNATPLLEGFEGGTFNSWDFTYSTNGAQSGSCPAGTWSSNIVSGASALSGSYSARLFADSTDSLPPWRVDAAINRTARRNGATNLKAMLKFDQITDPGTAPGHAFFYISVINAMNMSESISYGYDNSTLLAPGDISYNVSPGDLVNFRADVAGDYYNKYAKALPEEVVIRFLASADLAEPFGRQTISVRLDDIAFFGPSSPVETKTVTLTIGASTVISFTWNTTGVARSNYTISAVADTVPGETDTADNTYINGIVTVTIPGDTDGDGDVDYDDFIILAGAYGTSIGDPAYDESADFDSDGDVDYDDFILLAGNYGVTVPG